MFYEPSKGHGLPHDPSKAIVAPRPIGWISTLNKAGEINLAPYSFFKRHLDAALHRLVLLGGREGQRLLRRGDR